jgi:hypothetical protein
MLVYSDVDDIVDSPPDLNVKAASTKDLKFERESLHQDSEDLQQLIRDLKGRLAEIETLNDEIENELDERKVLEAAEEEEEEADGAVS